MATSTFPELPLRDSLMNRHTDVRADAEECTAEDEHSSSQDLSESGPESVSSWSNFSEPKVCNARCRVAIVHQNEEGQLASVIRNKVENKLNRKNGRFFQNVSLQLYGEVKSTPLYGCIEDICTDCEQIIVLWTPKFQKDKQCLKISKTIKSSTKVSDIIVVICGFNGNEKPDGKHIALEDTIPVYYDETVFFLETMENRLLKTNSRHSDDFKHKSRRTSKRQKTFVKKPAEMNSRPYPTDRLVQSEPPSKHVMDTEQTCDDNVLPNDVQTDVSQSLPTHVVLQRKCSGSSVPQTSQHMPGLHKLETRENGSDAQLLNSNLPPKLATVSGPSNTKMQKNKGRKNRNYCKKIENNEANSARNPASAEATILSQTYTVDQTERKIDEETKASSFFQARETEKSNEGPKTGIEKTHESPSERDAPDVETHETPSERDAPDVETHETPSERDAPDVETHETPSERDAPDVETQTPSERNAPDVETHETPSERDAPDVEAPSERDAPGVETHETPSERNAPDVEAPSERDAPGVETHETPSERDAPDVEAPSETDAPGVETQEMNSERRTSGVETRETPSERETPAAGTKEMRAEGATAGVGIQNMDPQIASVQNPNDSTFPVSDFEKHATDTPEASSSPEHIGFFCTTHDPQSTKEDFKTGSGAKAHSQSSGMESSANKNELGPSKKSHGFQTKLPSHKPAPAHASADSPLLKRKEQKIKPSLLGMRGTESVPMDIEEACVACEESDNEETDLKTLVDLQSEEETTNNEMHDMERDMREQTHLKQITGVDTDNISDLGPQHPTLSIREELSRHHYETISPPSESMELEETGYGGNVPFSFTKLPFVDSDYNNASAIEVDMHSKSITEKYQKSDTDQIQGDCEREGLTNRRMESYQSTLSQIPSSTGFQVQRNSMFEGTTHEIHPESPTFSEENNLKGFEILQGPICPESPTDLPDDDLKGFKPLKGPLLPVERNSNSIKYKEPVQENRPPEDLRPGTKSAVTSHTTPVRKYSVDHQTVDILTQTTMTTPSSPTSPGPACPNTVYVYVGGNVYMQIGDCDGCHQPPVARGSDELPGRPAVQPVSDPSATESSSQTLGITTARDRATEDLTNDDLQPDFEEIQPRRLFKRSKILQLFCCGQQKQKNPKKRSSRW